MQRVMLPIAILVIAGLFISLGCIWGFQVTGQSISFGVGIQSAFASEHAAAEGGHASGPPAVYFVQWLILLSALVIGIFYANKIRSKGKPRHEGIKIAYVLTLLALTYFGLGYYPTLTSYHEPGAVSFLKFILLLITGALVTFYGVLGRHDEH